MAAEIRMPFRNLYFHLKGFRDHNFCDFLGRFEEVTDEFLEAKYREGYFDGGIEPYFEPIIPLTLHPTSCTGFFRMGPKWPITERDYYLSKLFQFLFPPIRIKYGIDYRKEDEVERRLEEILDQVPDDVLPVLYRWDWWDFYRDTFELELDALLNRLSERLRDFCQRVRQGLPEETAPGRPVKGAGKRRRRRKPENEERDSIILHCLQREMDRFEICRVLDKKAIPTTRRMEARGIHRWAEAWTNLDFKPRVQQIFSKALARRKSVKPEELP